jgi:methanogenic corrinoid protein MtbC1
MHETIKLVRQRSSDWEHPLPVVIGGAAIDQHAADSVGADGWCTDAADGMAVIHTLVG